MAITNFTNGTLIKSSEVNSNFSEAYKLELLNHTRQLIDRAGVYSADGTDLWGEAYIDEDGRNNSVVTGSNTSVFDTNKYKTTPYIGGQADGDTLHNPTTFSNPTSAFDETTTTYADKTTYANWQFGTTFGAKNIDYVRVKWDFSGSSQVSTVTIKLQSYNGSIWSDEATLFSATATSGSYNSYVALNKSVQGLRLSHTSNQGSGAIPNHKIYLFDYNMTFGGSIIHTIPAGTFGATISSSVGKALVADWESGASVDYKLTNATEDTGWLTDGTVNTFTAFTSQPTTLIVRLNPKSSSPTAGYPSIKGFSLRCS